MNLPSIFNGKLESQNRKFAHPGDCCIFVLHLALFTRVRQRPVIWFQGGGVLRRPIPKHASERRPSAAA